MPLFEQLPRIYREPTSGDLSDGTDRPESATHFLEGYLAGLDEVVAPVRCVLDNLDAYVDAATAPTDFLAWLGSIVGVQLVRSWPLPQQRRQVATAVALHPWRGTVRGLRGTAAVYAGVEEDAVEVIDAGGTAWSVDPNERVGGHFETSLTIRIRWDRPMPMSDEDRRRLDGVMASSVPAGFFASVDLVTS